MRIEGYGMIGDTQTAALVGTDGSIDWLCLPRFDSGACFAALLGDRDHGRWRIAPVAEVRETARRYRPDTLILETEMTTDEGTVRLVDCMPVRDRTPDLVRIVEGVRGSVRMEMDLTIRFDYGAVVPWMRRVEGALRAVAGPDAVELHTPVETHGDGPHTVAHFTVREGERVPFVLQWYPSHEQPPPAVQADAVVEDTEAWWQEWCGRTRLDMAEGPWREAVERSLITLKALTYAPTGGIVAAPTTSLPERLGGVRNWDYRFCWVRDATFTLFSLLLAGHVEEAEAFRRWLLRTIAGDPADLQMLYGVAGERRLTELVLDHLPGYEGSAPVRIGNAAALQFQLDVYGEVLDTMHQARRAGLPVEHASWELERVLVEFAEKAWREPDEGIWEMRGDRRHFTHSKVMAWVALDRAVRAVEDYGLDGPADRWCATRDEIHAEVCERGFDAERHSFVQYYGAREVDAALLMIPLVGFLPADDDRVQGTVEAIRSDLMTPEGFVLRYRTEEARDVDGLPPGEGCFLPCTFWYADVLGMLGRTDEATEVFDRGLRVANDLGLLAEEYDQQHHRLIGNFPQAFTHVSLVNAALNLFSRREAPAQRRPVGSRHA